MENKNAYFIPVIKDNNLFLKFFRHWKEEKHLR